METFLDAEFAGAQYRPRLDIDISLALAPTTDVILQSSCGARFRAHKHLLAAAAPIFASMFTLPQTDAMLDTADLPVVEMAETEGVLRVLLQYIYPVPKPRMDSFGELGAVLRAAQKYELELVTSVLRHELVSPQYLRAYPMRVYIFACLYGLREEAAMAIKATMKYDLEDLLRQCRGDEMGNMLASDLALLWEKRFACADEAKKLFSKASLKNYCVPRCKCQRMTPWVEEWVRKALVEVGTRPVTDRIFSPEFVTTIIAGSPTECSCGRTFNNSWPTHWSILRAALDSICDTICI